MYRVNTNGGFTIVEVLIVISITTAILLATLPFLFAQQSKAEFSVGIKQLANTIQKSINNVASGYFNPSQSYSCGIVPPPISIGSGTSSIGSNEYCQFIGDALLFQDNNLEILPIAGLKYSNANTIEKVTSLAQSQPCVMKYFAGSTCVTDTNLDVSDNVNYQSGLRLASFNGVSSPGNGLIDIYSINSLNSSATISGSIDNLIIGTDSNPDNLLKQINTTTSSSTFNKSIDLCFNSARGDYSGVITIGANSNPTSVNLKINPGTC